jgi:hypothetical protein
VLRRPQEAKKGTGRRKAITFAHVAELLGHSGTAMLHRHYAHLGAKAKALREALSRIR